MILSLKKNVNLTHGNIYKSILSFSIPLLIGLLFNQFYSVVDTIIVGKALGVEALSGVGSTSSINFLIVGFCNGVAAGLGIPIAQAYGAKDFKKLRSYLANCLYFGLFFCITLTLFSTVFCRDILRWMKTLESVFEYAYEYIFVIFFGIPLIFLYGFLEGVLRSLGETKVPVLILIFAAIINIVLDSLFLLVFHLGIRWAAIATLISQFFSVIICFIYLKTHFDFIHIQKKEWKFSLDKTLKLTYVSIPMGLQYSITAIGSVILTTQINTLDSVTYVAAIVAAGRINNFFATPFEALGSAMATYIGQNAGAKEYNRIIKGTKIACLFGFIYSIISFIILFFFGGKMSIIFLDKYDQNIVDAAQMLLTITSSTYMLLTIVNVVRYSIQGMGYSLFAIFSGVMEMIGRVFVAMILIKYYGYLGSCFASPVAWLLADLFLIPGFLFCFKRIQKKNIL